MSTWKKKTTWSTAALWLALCFGLSACGGSGSDSNTDKLLESEFSVPGNWTAYETYDQVGAGVAAAVTAAKSDARAVEREKIVTYTANGVVAEAFDYLTATEDSIAMGSRQYGISMLNFDDLSAPKGKVYNYRKNSLNGLSTDQDQFYAWFFDGSLVNITTGISVYSDAPMGTQTNYGATPKNRMVIQDGDFFIGTSNLETDGNLRPDTDNGLWKIDVTHSEKTKLIDYPVWCLYKDSTNTIWAGTDEGIYRQDGSAFTNVHDGYAEQIFEFDNQTYALIKDFFHKPGDNTDFDLYWWNGNAFEYKCEISEGIGNMINSMHAFVWNNILYVSYDQTYLLVFDGSTFSRQVNPIYDGKIGQYCVLPADGRLFSVGNLTGLNIWDGVDYTQLNTVNTTEGLLSNDIQVLHVHSQGNLWIGSPVSGFNMLDEEGNFTSIELVEQISIGGIFEHDGTTYAQGADIVYAIGPDDLHSFADFNCNGEKVYYDAPQGRLWAFPNFGSGNGALGMLDMDTKKIWGTTGYDNREDYWQRDYTWEKPPYHFNDVIAIPDEDAVFIALENGDGKILKYEYLTDTFITVDIPITAIRYFDRTDKAVFGVGPGSIVKYENGSWTVVNSVLVSNSPVDLLVKHNYAFVPNPFNLEVVHLVSGKTSMWNFDELPIEGQIQTIAMRTNQDPGGIKKAYAIIFGTDAGLVLCNLNLH